MPHGSGPSDDYFPQTQLTEIDSIDVLKALYNMSLEQQQAQGLPNGAAPPTSEPTKSKDAPNKMSLHLSHLPSKQDIKLVYPRTPTSVSTMYYLIATHSIYSHWYRSTLTTRHGLHSEAITRS